MSKRSRSKSRSKPFYVLGLCTCDTKEQKEEIKKVISKMQENKFLPKTKYYIHLVNFSDRDAVSRLKKEQRELKKHSDPLSQTRLKRIGFLLSGRRRCSTKDHSFPKKFLFSRKETQDSIWKKIEKYRYRVIFNHFCPISSDPQSPFSEEGLNKQEKVRDSPFYLVSPYGLSAFNERFKDKKKRSYWNKQRKSYIDFVKTLKKVKTYTYKRKGDEKRKGAIYCSRRRS